MQLLGQGLPLPQLLLWSMLIAGADSTQSLTTTLITTTAIPAEFKLLGTGACLNADDKSNPSMYLKEGVVRAACEDTCASLPACVAYHTNTNGNWCVVLGAGFTEAGTPAGFVFGEEQGTDSITTTSSGSGAATYTCYIKTVTNTATTATITSTITTTTTTTVAAVTAAAATTTTPSTAFDDDFPIACKSKGYLSEKTGGANCAAEDGTHPGSDLMNAKLGREHPFLGPVSCADDFNLRSLFVKQGSGACQAIVMQLKAFDSVIFEHIKCFSKESRSYWSFKSDVDGGATDAVREGWCNAALPVLKQWVDSVPGKWILGEPNQSCVEVCAAQPEFSRCDLNVLTAFGSGDVPTLDWTDRCAGKGNGNLRLHPSLRVSDSKCFTNGVDDDARATCETKDPDSRRFCPCSSAYGTSSAASKWTRIAHCAGTDRLDFDTDKIMRMAKGATQIRICTRGSSDDCVESYPDTYPIKMLREGKAVSHNNGVSQSTIDEIKKVWSGPAGRLAALTSSCTSNATGTEGDAGIMFDSGEDGSYFFHACGNSDGLRISLHDGGYCVWDYGTGSDNLDIFINVPGPTTCTDLSCDIASYDGVDGLINNPHFAKAKNGHFMDGTATLHVEDGKGFWWGKRRASTKLSNGKQTWTCAPDDCLHLLPPINAVSLSITYSGAYDSPNGSTGQMVVSDGAGLLYFRDAHASASSGQSLRVPYYNSIYTYAQNNEVDRTDILTLTSSAVANGIQIKMCGSNGGVDDDGLDRPYSKRYIKSIIWNTRPVPAAASECPAGKELVVQDTDSVVDLITGHKKGNGGYWGGGNGKGCGCRPSCGREETCSSNCGGCACCCNNANIGLSCMLSTSNNTFNLCIRRPTREKIGFPYLHGEVNTNRCPTIDGLSTALRLTEAECFNVASNIARSAFARVNLSYVPRGCSTAPDTVTAPRSKESQGKDMWITVLYNEHPAGAANASNAPLCIHPTTCTDLSCDIASYDGVDALVKNPHYVTVASKNKHFNDNPIQVEVGKGFTWGKSRPVMDLPGAFGDTWFCHADDYLHLLPPRNAGSVAITYSGAYNTPIGSVGQMYVTVEDDSARLLKFSGASQLDANGHSTTYLDSDKVDVVDRTDVLKLSDTAVAKGIKIGMCGWYSSSPGDQPYSPRYIKSIIWNARPVPAPLNTGVHVFKRVVYDSREYDEVWQDACSKVPSSAIYIMVAVGTKRDFYRPVKGVCFCDMFSSTSRTNYEWSDDGTNWVSGRTQSSSAFKAAKHHLSYSNELLSTLGRSYTFAYGLALQPPPPNTFLSANSFVELDGQPTAGMLAYWQSKCTEVPAKAEYAMLDMGAVRDYFKPIEGASWCDVFTNAGDTAREQTLWSRDGIHWLQPAAYRTHYGGSADDVQKWRLPFTIQIGLPRPDHGCGCGGCCSAGEFGPVGCSCSHTCKATTGLPGYCSAGEEKPTTSIHNNGKPYGCSPGYYMKEKVCWPCEDGYEQLLPQYIGSSCTKVAGPWIPFPTSCDIDRDGCWSFGCKKSTSTTISYLTYQTIEACRKSCDLNPGCVAVVTDPDDNLECTLYSKCTPERDNSIASGDHQRLHMKVRNLPENGSADLKNLPAGVRVTPVVFIPKSASNMESVTSDFWNGVCSESLPKVSYRYLQTWSGLSGADFIVLQIDATTAFFKPSVGVTTCEMLSSQGTSAHSWSPGGVAWVPCLKNGDCNVSLSEYLSGNAGVGFTVYYGVNPFYDQPRVCPTTSTTTTTTTTTIALQPLPPNTEMSLIVSVTGTTLANNVYWAEECKKIPSNTLFLVLDMGAVRDFFKPVDAGTTYCEMLQSNNKHQWSPNGKDWAVVSFDVNNSWGLGGSAESFPSNNDKRQFLSFWGHNSSATRKITGGCCSSSSVEPKTWPNIPSNLGAYSSGQSFTLSWVTRSKCVSICDSGSGSYSARFCDHGRIDTKALCCPEGWTRDEGDGSRCNAPGTTGTSNARGIHCYLYGNCLPFTCKSGDCYFRDRSTSTCFPCPSVCVAAHAPNLPQCQNILTTTTTTTTTTPLPPTPLPTAGAPITRTKLNLGAVSCGEYCRLALNDEAVLGSRCRAAVRGAVAVQFSDLDPSCRTASPSTAPTTTFEPLTNTSTTAAPRLPALLAANSTGGDGDGDSGNANGDDDAEATCIACTAVDYNISQAVVAWRDRSLPVTCWCESPITPRQSATADGPLQPPKCTQQNPCQIVLHAEAWRAANIMNADAGWDPLQLFQTKECAVYGKTQRLAVNTTDAGSCSLDAAFCRKEPYVLRGVAPNVFRQYLRYTATGVNTAADSFEFLPAEIERLTAVEVDGDGESLLSATFSIQWNVLANTTARHDGPGGFYINETDGGIPNGEPRQAGYYYATIIASVASKDAAYQPVSQFPIKSFAFQVEGTLPFQIVNYGRNRGCNELSNELRNLQKPAEPAAEDQGCDRDRQDYCWRAKYHELSLPNCYAGSSGWIAAINLTEVTTSDQVGKEVTFSLSGAPPGFMVDSATGSIRVAPPLGSDRDQPYTVSLIASDDAGSKALVESFAVYILKRPVPAAVAVHDSGALIASVLGSIIALLLCALVAHQYHAYTLKMAVHNFEETISSMLAGGHIDDDQAGDRFVPREVKRSCITLVTELGKGAFGAVWKGLLKEPSMPERFVAVKTVLDADKTPEGAEDLLQEAVVMAQVGFHRNVVTMIGVVTSGEPLLLVLELCGRGSLLGVLQEWLLKDEPLAVPVKLQLCVDVAQGMMHLHSKRFIHRDLAARNVLVDEGGVGKVADFGLSRGGHSADGGGDNPEEEQYYKSQHGKFPIRWSAPESIETYRFTFASDVWASLTTVSHFLPRICLRTLMDCFVPPSVLHLPH